MKGKETDNRSGVKLEDSVTSCGLDWEGGGGQELPLRLVQEQVSWVGLQSLLKQVHTSLQEQE